MGCVGCVVAHALISVKRPGPNTASSSHSPTSSSSSSDDSSDPSSDSSSSYSTTHKTEQNRGKSGLHTSGRDKGMGVLVTMCVLWLCVDAASACIMGTRSRHSTSSPITHSHSNTLVS